MAVTASTARVDESGSYAVPLALMVSLYFGIGFITTMNDVLVPHFKDLFHLTNSLALLVPFCFFGAYFVMSIPSGKIVRRVGYQRGIVMALVTMSAGLLLFLPASVIVQYWLFLLALFVVGSGLALLQVAINPYVGALGTPETAASRLNLAGGFNSVAGTLAPRVGAMFVFVAAGGSAAVLARSVRMPYMVLAGFALLMALAAKVIPLPKLMEETTSAAMLDEGGSAWQFRHLRLGALGIFTYVGAEVAIGSLMISYLGQPSMGGMSHVAAAKYVSLYWGCAMVARFVGFVVLRKVSAAQALTCTALAAMLAVLIAMLAHGPVALWALVSCGLFNSVMWACIFPMSLKGLGRFTSQGSGILVMMVVGGAVIPEIQGLVADAMGYAPSFAVVLVCYAYLLFFALRGHRNVQEGWSTHPELTPVDVV